MCGPVRASNVPRAACVLLALAAVGLHRWTVPVDGAKILAVETIRAKSHWNFMSAVLRSLAGAGHNVTVFAPFYKRGDGAAAAVANLTVVDTSDDYVFEIDQDLMPLLDIFGSPFKSVAKLNGYNRLFCDLTHGNGRLRDVLERGADERFDVFVVEALAYDCMSHVASKLNVPVIYLIPSPMISYSEREFTGHSSNPACVSHLFAPHAVPRTFVQRFYNAALWTYNVLRFRYDRAVMIYTDPRPYDSSPKVDPSIIFQNSHYVTEASRPVTPNVIDVGGIHLTPAKTIPKDILDFIENSPHGVIYFTFGSIVKLSSLPEHVEKAFKDALAQVPQNVLWKYEGEMKDPPKNVMLRTWFPQREILLHPKVKLFISHGGISGVYEAVDAGVPVLGFPLIYDQPRNIDNLVNNGMAISMDLLSITKENLLNNVLELVNNEKYSRNAKIASGQFKDRPLSPEQLVVYWTEYVIRHNGAPHLRSHGLNLTWYQYLLLDVIATVLILIFIVLFAACKFFKLFRNFTMRFFRNNKVKTH